ncbi:amino acid ABC transporter substrate-binding protein [Verminephrobacter aporrectodeae subsp. tuberculatae]|uniref:transporter substrate-binding domain-containing protein n=1 Tax=Verminephrobacter aporrectodeae TaxID=1110389 RepID=UPI000237572C|nr:transporter substrate-binding domain-containing protein [Verminephrobacter aporrectodeae]MCW5258267.1 amino acid ABC transporter substrate-binding protein [Verminephrobacter aporrectodeae subsp. tuberculatae]MCW8166111.1 amino acid ABC transporter substrate-binding protein [Verminephrobacter aporrectodeae subsp. tuberculatae]MCW8170104.1 amino acid ABC transporter substrate-binding protein [Verminephrobacter aporrectodeae subsp. tuberculatae]MCW8198881.1 amino acid ABC transporter substrate-
MNANPSCTPEPGWRIGVLFSRAGITQATETEHFYGTVLAIEEINAAGGVAGRPLDPVVHDPKGDANEYRKLAQHLLREDDVSVIFGCSTSSSRKAVLPVIERNNALLWYSSIHEGFEYSPNVIYTGAVPNQNSMQLAAWLLRHRGRRFFLVGADYIYPRESNRIMRDMVQEHGGEIVAEVYLPSDAGPADLEPVVQDIEGVKPDVVFSTLIGRAARAFYTLYREHGIDPARIPIASLTMTEYETRMIGPALCGGHIVAASYVNTLDNDSNRRFLASWRTRFGALPASMWSEMAYNQVHLFALALARARTLDTEKLVAAVHAVEFDSPEGLLRIDPGNNHAILTPRIAVCRPDGAFDVVWESRSPIKPDPYLTAYGFSDFWIEGEAA